ncbi:hypothetical protein DOK_11681 [gamma proteobacterium BDW918]|nr:hypothetical protein DOK_11681 [gamma proteobacterium BDW918]
MEKKEFINLIAEGMPNVDATEILELAEVCVQQYDEKLKGIDSLDKWFPSRDAIRETRMPLIKGGVDFDKAVRTFRELCNSKNWSLDDRLDSRFIVHCKFISQ